VQVTVAELIELLTALPEEQKEYQVGCTYESNYGFTWIYGIDSVGDEDSPKPGVRLQGD
jgi:hypothetical protein